MSILSGTIRAKATIEAASNPNIVNLPMAIASTEYSYAISAGTKQLSIRARQKAKLRMAFVSGDTAIKFVTIENGCNYFLDNVTLNGITLYLQADQPSIVVEIEEWI
jgi:hypothetical protein